MTDTLTTLKLTGYDRIKDTSNRFYSNKIRNNPDFYAKEKERIKEYKKNRYNTDPRICGEGKNTCKRRILY